MEATTNNNVDEKFELNNGFLKVLSNHININAKENKEFIDYVNETCKEITDGDISIKDALFNSIIAGYCCALYTLDHFSKENKKNKENA